MKTAVTKWEEFVKYNTKGMAGTVFKELDAVQLPKEKQKLADDARMIRNVAESLARDGDSVLAFTRIGEATKAVEVALAEMLAETKEGWKKLEQARKAIQSSIKQKDFGDPPPTAIAQQIATFEDAIARYIKAGSEYRYRDQLQAKNDCEASVAELRKQMDLAMDNMGGTASSAADKRLAMGALQARFGIQLDRDNRCDCGPSDLDAGAKCPKCNKKVTEPVYSSKILPKLYKLLKDLPAGHVVDNPSFLALRRTREDDASWFQSKDKTVVLNLKQTSGPRGMFNNLKHTIGNPHYTGKGDWLVNEFQDFAYHEVAHAVDDKTGFMDKNGTATAYGGWKKSNEIEALTAGAEAKGFFAAFPQYPRSFLFNYLQSVARNRKPAPGTKAVSPDKDPKLSSDWMMAQAVADSLPKTEAEFVRHPAVVAAVECRKVVAPKGDEQLTVDDAARDFTDEWKKVTQACDKEGPKGLAYREVCARIALRGESPTATYGNVGGGSTDFTDTKTKPDFKALAKHEVNDWVKNVVMSGGENGLWDKGSSAAKKYAIKGRVYQEAYKDDWWSYDLSARGDIVVDYQFRAPGEWFAEAYAAHHIGKLSETHEVAKWLKSEEGKKAPKRT
ncbi:MAG: hypothetical protein K2Y51_00505 [Gammaproteobacteria bacterium]|nr:hypothetical protein [Gammaproteobacteria bacterium]